MFQTSIYNTSLALLTDFYQLSMAYAYWKNQVHRRQAIFCLYFRQNPFQGGFSVMAGLEQALDYLTELRFDSSDLDYLASLKGVSSPLFDDDFLRFLQEFRFGCDVWAVEEGTVVFPNEPLVRVEGDLWQCQLVESALLNIINFQTLIATKAARVRLAAGQDTILEFGMRRGQGIDGAVSASRAAFIGGADATSNVLAAKLYGLPVRGTHAHSWVMTFDTEAEAFEAYSRAMPENTTLLVDTYNTLEGVDNAITTGLKLKELGYQLQAIRLDSGDLAYLSVEARKKLDSAGLHQTKIVASNDLDEYIISSLKTQQDARIDIWGVGTRLTTAFEQPALGGVYKMTALKDSSGQWQHKIKLSDQAIKTSIPGRLQTARVHRNGEFIADMIYDELLPASMETIMVDPADPTRRKKIHLQPDNYETLLIPVIRGGQLVYQKPSIYQIKARTIAQMASLHPSIKRFTNPHSYPVGLEQGLFNLRNELIMAHKNM